MKATNSRSFFFIDFQNKCQAKPGSSVCCKYPKIRPTCCRWRPILPMYFQLSVSKTPLYDRAPPPVRSYNGIVRLYNGTARSYNGAARLYNGIVRLYNGIVRLYNGIVRLYNGIVRLYNGIVRSYNGIVRLYNGTVRSYNGIVQKLRSGSGRIWRGDYRLSPNTSSKVKIPWRPAIHSAASTAPAANAPLPRASCLRVSTSLAEVKVVTWVPGTSPWR